MYQCLGFSSPELENGQMCLGWKFKISFLTTHDKKKSKKSNRKTKKKNQFDLFYDFSFIILIEETYKLNDINFKMKIEVELRFF